MAEKILALGFFDGVHRGHTALLHTAAGLSREQGLRSAALTFTTHPSALLNGQSVPLLSSLRERELLLQRWGGTDETVFLPFDHVMQTTPWQDFLAMLCSEQDARGFVCGHDFRFGSRGEGDGSALCSWCGERGLLCAVVPAVTYRGTVVSSTHIRALLSAGSVEEAVDHLGHPYLLCGAPEGALLPVPEGHQTLPAGRYRAGLTLPDGTVLPDETVESVPEGLLLPFVPPIGELTAAITGRA